MTLTDLFVGSTNRIRFWASVGVVNFAGLSVALIVHASVGVTTGDAFAQGVVEQGWLGSIGRVWLFVIQPVLIAAAFLLARVKPDRWTIGLSLVGPFCIDLYLDLIPVPTALPVRLLIFAIGLATSGISIALGVRVVQSGFSTELFTLALITRFGLSLRLSRGLLDAGFVVGGFVLGGNVGLGTVATLFGVGPIAQWWSQLLPEPVSEPEDPEPRSRLTIE